MKPKRSLETLKISRYDHGGGRIYFDDGTDRELVADTYHEADRELIYDAIKASLAKPAERKPEVGDIVAWVRHGYDEGVPTVEIVESEARARLLGNSVSRRFRIIMRRAEVEARIGDAR